MATSSTTRALSEALLRNAIAKKLQRKVAVSDASVARLRAHGHDPETDYPLDVRLTREEIACIMRLCGK